MTAACKPSISGVIGEQELAYGGFSLKVRVLFVGAGAIGACIAAWVAAQNEGVTVLDVGEVTNALRESGITTYEIANPSRTRRTINVRVAERPRDCSDADIVVLAVKNYNLSEVARQVREELGDRPIIVSMANGRENQEILPKFFSRVIYCVVGFNARRDVPVVVGYQRKGPLLIGTPDNTLGAELRQVQGVLARGCPTEITERLQDAVHTKIVMNLTNALDALVGRGYWPLSSFSVYQYLLSKALWEGVQVVRAAGFHEHRIAGIPSFTQLRIAALLPGWLIRPVFRRKMRAMVLSSMTQDVTLRGAVNTELESITGYLVRLAADVGVRVPYNEAIYRLAKENFHPGFKPLSCEDVLAAASSRQRP